MRILGAAAVAAAFFSPVTLVLGVAAGSAKHESSASNGTSDSDRVHLLDVRQASAAASSPGSAHSAPTSTTRVGETSPTLHVSPSPSPSTSAPAAGSAGTQTPAFTLHATNPTAYPLSVINKDETVLPTRGVTYATPGAVPTGLGNAPGIPDVSSLNPADYPPLDKVPPVDSEEVRKWVQEVKDTGIAIPGLAATQPGGCANNTAFASDAGRCWWTCSGCTRTTDVAECPAALSWGLTYDDGPSPYTPDLLAYLAEAQLRATFFVVGSRALSYPRILQSEHMAGHQVAVHTWSHAPLTTLSDEEVVAELGWTWKVIKDVLGVTPTMMRPPTGDIDDRVRAISLAMGLTPVMWSRVNETSTFDTDDFNIRSGKTSVQQVLHNWGTIISTASARSSGFIVLAHDLFEQTVQVATGYILPDALTHEPPLAIQPVVSCLGKDLRDACVETADTAKNPPAISEAVASGEVTLTGSTRAAGAEKTTETSGATSVDLGAGGWLSLVVTSVFGMTLSRFLQV